MSLNTREHRKSTMLGLFAVIAVAAMYHLVFFNRVFPIQEGWFSCIAHEMLSGRTPYKDFYLFLQPLYPLEITGLTSLFGDSFITFRIVGMVERLLLVAILYLMLKRILTARHAMVITLASLAVYASHTTDVIYSYYQTCLFFGLLSAYLLLTYLERPVGRRDLIIACTAGVLAGLGFMTKQSTGLFVTAALGAVLLIASFRLNKPMSKLSVPVYIAGWLCPVAACFSWLASKGAFRSYVEQVYRGASSSKGSVLGVLFSFYTRAFTARYCIAFLVMCFAVYLSRILFKDRGLDPAEERSGQAGTARAWVAVIAASLFCFLFPILYRPIFGAYPSQPFYVLKLCVIHISFYVSILASIVLFIRVWTARERGRDLQLFLLSIVSLSIMYAHGLSFTLEEHAVIPSIGLMFAVLLPLVKGPARLKAVALYACCFTLIFFCAVQKYAWPYEWWGWREPNILDATQKSTIGALKGFRVSPLTNEVITGVTALTKKYSAKDDTIFTYPHIPIFYVLSGRYPSTFALVHYFDVCPDSYAIRDAAELFRKPPAVIVNLEFPEWVWKFHEDAFRKGALSGQRKIAAAIDQLTRGGNMDSSASSRPHWAIRSRCGPGDEQASRRLVRSGACGLCAPTLPSGFPVTRHFRRWLEEVSP